MQDGAPIGCVHLQGLIGVTLSAGVPALQDGSHVNRAAFYMGFLYIIAIGLPAKPALLCCLSFMHETAPGLPHGHSS